MAQEEPLDFSKIQVGSIAHPKTLWPREVEDFTPWLIDHLSLLGEALEVNLSLVSREAPLGDFRADIVAQDERGRKVIIENQFGPTDHKHLGQVVSYACEAKADVMVWVSVGSSMFGRQPFRPEHVRALDRLNVVFDGQVAFYGVAVTLESEMRPFSEPPQDDPLLPRLSVEARPGVHEDRSES
jgi:hypothetical protein